MIDIFLIIPVIAAAALIAYIDYETHIVQKRWILLLALILGVVFSSAYLYGRNKYFDADFTQKITMLGSRVTQNGKCTVVWQPWTMPLCVPIAGSLLIMMYFWIL